MDLGRKLRKGVVDNSPLEDALVRHIDTLCDTWLFPVDALAANG